MSELQVFTPDDQAVLQAAPAPVGRTAAAEARRYLIVTAPFGPFSRHLASALRAAGADCRRVLINAGDVAEWGLADAIAYSGGPDGWPDWIAQRLAAEGVTDLITHGDNHAYAAGAIREAARLGVRVHVFEQGYFRPHWVTLERDGVNANSRLSRSPEHYRRIALAPHQAQPSPVGRITPAAVRWIALYHLWSWLGTPLFPRYRAPYPNSPVRQALGHARRYLGLKVFRSPDADRLAAAVHGREPVFLGLLQRPGDSQLTRHSQFAASEAFIRTVAESFSRHAPADARLIFKVHPLDHGLENHAAHVRRIAAELGLAERAVCVEGGHLPTLLKRATGVVCVNSTAGLAALEAGRPTVVLGEAIYDMPGLTHQGGLDGFWRNGEAPDAALYQAYSASVMAACQINGAFSTAHGIHLVVPEAVRRLLAAV